MALKNIGALWLPPAGKTYLCSGTIEIDGVKRKVFVFKAKEKKKEKSPDFNIAEQIPDAETPNGSPATTAEVENIFSTSTQPVDAPVATEPAPSGPSDGDTPF